MLKGCGEWCRLEDMFNIKCLLSSHDMTTFVMRSKDESTRNGALLRYTCGHDGRYFGLFHVIVMDHHTCIFRHCKS